MWELDRLMPGHAACCQIQRDHAAGLIGLCNLAACYVT